MKKFTLITKEGELTVDGEYTTLSQSEDHLEVLFTFRWVSYNLLSLKDIAENNSNIVVGANEMDIDGTLYSVIGMGGVDDTKTEICFYLTKQ